MARLFRNAAIFIAGLVALSLVVGSVDSLDDVDVAGPKLAHFAERRNDYDAIFIGSSYVYREVAPERFDAVVAAERGPWRSFNLGVPGMDPPETYALLERALDLEPARLRYVFVELDYYREKVRPRNLHTRRFDYWHDLPTTIESAEAVLESNANPGKKAKDLASHGEAFVRRLFNVGRGPALLAQAEPPGPEVLGAALDGFKSLDAEQSQTYALRRGLFDAMEGDRLDEKVAALRDAAGGEAPGDGVGEIDRIALARAIALVRARGATPILFIPPCLAPRADLVAMARELDVPLLVFNSPERFPSLYDPANRFDLGHLNERGSLEFTRLLAEASLPVIER